MRFLSLLGLLVALSCTKSEQSDLLALPEGSYALEGPVCKSSGQEPNYPSSDKKLVLYRFQNLHTRNWQIQNGTSKMIYQSLDCKLTISRTSFTNTLGIFSFTQSKQHSWEPQSCSLAIDVQGKTTYVADKQTAFLGDTESGKEDIRFIVKKISEQKFELLTVDEAPLDRAWGDFGCQSPDQIIYSLTRL